MRLQRLTALGVGLAAVLSVRAATGQAQQAEQQRDPTPDELRARSGAALSTPLAPQLRVNPATSADWPLNHLYLKNSRYSTLNQISSSNVRSLAVRWLYHAKNAASTPIVANGIMYLTTPTSVIALDATTG